MKVEWISVEDRVPDESVDVLSVGHRHGPFWLGSESHEVLLGEVVAWTELPEPAEE